MYIVPEDLREDFKNYRENIEIERRRASGAVLYRYSRRKINKQFVIITKIALVLGTGILMIAMLCNLSTSKKTSVAPAQSTMNSGSYQDQHSRFGSPNQATQARSAQYQSKRYVEVPLYRTADSHSYTIWQPVNVQSIPSKSFVYTTR